MSKTKKSYTPFAIDASGALFVEVRAVMHPLVPYMDGLPITVFDKEHHAYLGVDVAIDWCREELATTKDEKYQTMINTLERFKAEVASGKAVVNE